METSKHFTQMRFILICAFLVTLFQANLVYSRKNYKQLLKKVKVTKMNLNQDLIQPNLEISTGLDFLGENFKITQNISFFLKNDLKNISALEFVQMFIKSVKGVEVENNENDTILFLSGTDVEMKPDWCFHPYELRELVKVELNIYKAFMKMFPEKTEYAVLESYIKDIEESSLLGLYNAKNGIGGANIGDRDDAYLYIASHPILVYRMIRRFVEDLPHILSQLMANHEQLVEHMLIVEDINPDLLMFPDWKDWDDAIEAMGRIQRENNLNTYEFGIGTLENTETGIGFNVLQMLEIGAFYLEKDDNDYAVQWFHLAIETIQQSRIVKIFPEILQFCEKMLKFAINEHNEIFYRRIGYTWHPGVFNEPIRIPFQPDQYIRQFDKLKPDADEERNNRVWNWAMQENFRRVCSGENLQTEEEKSVLSCWYDTSRNPYWKINPLKTELLSKVPDVYQFYDLIGDKLISKLKTSAIDELERSEVVDKSTPDKSKVGKERTSTQTWLKDSEEENNYLLSLTRTFELLSGLVINHPVASSAYQVASYGPSHHYNVHLDAFKQPERSLKKGNRITTIMGYLSDVTAGGRTGFPVLGIAAEPIKGSVVMWDNLMRNGQDRDSRTWHGGCPVVLGIKWITNKWIFYKENSFTFQCTLNPDE